ncbi:hypothetical protein PVAP13_5KG474307 [Panicum virgatum]|uniref:Uncharacterized protein n=1 Tax=Panicum virgatum TaxID=38727 RepID=A0A8T0SSU7_PANVG|nr:hypothetical protein PVAP13_5KG474307 [Panicum virgatum]
MSLLPPLTCGPRASAVFHLSPSLAPPVPLASALTRADAPPRPRPHPALPPLGAPAPLSLAQLGGAAWPAQATPWPVASSGPRPAAAQGRGRRRAGGRPVARARGRRAGRSSTRPERRAGRSDAGSATAAAWPFRPAQGQAAALRGGVSTSAAGWYRRAQRRGPGPHGHGPQRAAAGSRRIGGGTAMFWRRRRMGERGKGPGRSRADQEADSWGCLGWEKAGGRVSACDQSSGRAAAKGGLGIFNPRPCRPWPASGRGLGRSAEGEKGGDGGDLELAEGVRPPPARVRRAPPRPRGRPRPGQARVKGTRVKRELRACSAGRINSIL